VVILCPCFFALFPSVCKAEERVITEGHEVERAVEAAKQWYAVLAPKLAPTNVPFAGMYRKPFKPDGAPPAEIKRDANGTLAYIRAQFMFILEQPSHRVVSVSNPALRKFIEANDTQEVAGFATNRAVEIANGYLQTIGFQCRHPLMLEDVKFNWFLDKHAHCVGSLQKLTGMKFRGDYDAWKDWWKQTGQYLPFDEEKGQLVLPKEAE